MGARSPRLLSRAAGALLLLLALWLPARPAAAQQGLDLQITVFTYPDEPDKIGLTYDREITSEEIKQDFALLAAELGTPSPAVKIARAEGYTTAEAKLEGLVDWSAGTVNLDALIRTYRDFGRFQVLFFFHGPFPSQPIVNVTGDRVRVQSQISGNIVAYEIHVDQSRGVPRPDEVRTAAPARGPEKGRVLVVVLAAVIAAACLFLFVSAIRTRRRSPDAGEGES